MKGIRAEAQYAVVFVDSRTKNTACQLVHPNWTNHIVQVDPAADRLQVARREEVGMSRLRETHTHKAWNSSHYFTLLLNYGTCPKTVQHQDLDYLSRTFPLILRRTNPDAAAVVVAAAAGDTLMLTTTTR
jgi:hypothetical protein